jgi:hypothetical protein
MWSRSKKTMLAIEWIWLFIGTAVVFTHVVEAWARPYLPTVWMVGVLVLFLAYRLGMAVRAVYWPEPELSPQAKRLAKKEAYEAAAQRGGDGIVSTTEWVPPHIRGRRARQKASDSDAARADNNPEDPGSVDSAETAETAERLELPSASGSFDGADIVTVFTEVDEDTEPQKTEIVDAGIPFHATSIVRVDDAPLRPETKADLSQHDLTVPSFAESTLTGVERKIALDAVHHAGPDEVTVNQSAPRSPGSPAPASSNEDTSPMRIQSEPEDDRDDEGPS